TRGVDLATRGLDAFCKAGNRHAHIRDDAFAAGTQPERREVGGMACTPELAAALLVRCRFETGRAVRADHFTGALELFFHTVRGAVKFDDQRRLLAQRHVRIGVASTHLTFVEELDARTRRTRTD